jgi:hypothetical protein
LNKPLVVPWHRAVVMLGFIGLMVYGPMAKQVFEVRDGRLRSWVMYSGHSLDLCWVEYSGGQDGEERVLLDRYSMLGYDGKWDAPKSVRRIRDRPEAESMGRRLCGELGRDADVRVVGECATRQGWEEEFVGTKNLCAAAVKASPSTSPKPKSKPSPPTKEGAGS